MTGETLTHPGAVHMGHGQMVDITDAGNGAWRLAFSAAGVAEYAAPPLADIKVDAIDPNGEVHALAIGPGPDVSSVVATGRTAAALRARVMVVHGAHFHTRETALAGGAAMTPVPGPLGGSLVALDGGASVEVTAAGVARWQLTFLADGAKAAAPAPAQVAVEAIGPRCEDYQVRELMVLAGPDSATLVASGKIQDAAHVRLVVTTGDGAIVRSAPVAQGIQP